VDSSEDYSLLGYRSLITLMTEAVRTSEISVYINETTWCYNPEGSNLHTQHSENLKSQLNIC
jgi:hypothetical protein